ncbi:hypothetical protein C5167_049133 [Papaver somniferum]|uniref:Uncharacterized protein n=1 Tax=Papaver somniferum TaxID=3469 RepID=A0A4Y7KJY3_PAPSO|nr:hypothetical protein C5167_049133 [Papaver somniferum]
MALSCLPLNVKARQCKVDMPIARFNLRFEVEDHAGAPVFVALDSQVQKLVCQKAAELIGAMKLI